MKEELAELKCDDNEEVLVFSCFRDDLVLILNLQCKIRIVVVIIKVYLVDSNVH